MLFRFLTDGGRASPPVPVATRAKKTLRLGRRIMRQGKWLEIEEEILHLLVPRGKVSIDVGANKGTYTVPLALLSRHVIAIEPEPAHCETVRRAGMPNVTVRQTAISSEPGTATLSIPVDPVGGGDLVGYASLETPTDTDSYREIEVETCCLDTFADEDVGFVKIDVEGHEQEALAGSTALIAKNRPVFLVEVEERHRPGAVAAVFGFFAGQGYAGFFVFGDRTHDLEAHADGFSDPAVLDENLPRNQTKYVNNFIFAPDAALARTLRKQIETRLWFRNRLQKLKLIRR